ncbi:hypothetical protein ABIF65_010183 [Bradyrhizobium japonicum]|nr:hypothetical protein [Bradyrhizobium japonicum]MCP1783621.1 hypothetical protein [Bradyrhizobium japonicum]MCP1866123.1 hypothetical protein [Bradyrhizobium japonicum]MCP1896705.1 hypothetical protein [Bradyrhizobium japonicum]MCP1964090.1 hypothetical protein [Bradyrhizobium japonicum]
MHQDAALRASCRLARKADQIRLLALEAEFRRVMEDEDRSLPRRYALARRLEMTAKNIRLVDPLVGEESIGGLRVGPILTNQRDALTHVAPDLCEQFAEPATKPLILKLASRNFPINPRLDTGRQSLSTRHRAFLHQAHRAPRTSESGAQQRITTDSTDSRFRPRPPAQIRRQMWVIERFARRLHLVLQRQVCDPGIPRAGHAPQETLLSKDCRSCRDKWRIELHQFRDDVTPRRPDPRRPSTPAVVAR